MIQYLSLFLAFALLPTLNFGQASYLNKAREASQNNAFSDAIKLYKKTLRSLKASGDSLEFGKISVELATCLRRKLGKYGEALHYYEAALPIYESNLSNKDTLLGDLYSFLGITFSSTGNCDNGLLFHKKATKSRIHTYGVQHLKVGKSYYGQATCLKETGQYAKALDNYKKALDIFIKLKGEKSTMVASVYNSLGILSNYTDPSKVAYYFEKALSLKKELLGEGHPDLIEIYNNLGLTYLSGTDLNLAETYLRKAITISVNHFGKKNHHLPSAYNNLALMFFAKLNFKEALYYATEALQISKYFMGNENIELVSIMQCLASIHAKEYNYEKALTWYTKAEEILLLNHSVEHPYYVDICSAKANIYQEFGYHQKAIETINELIHQLQRHDSTYAYGIEILLTTKGNILRAEGRHKEAIVQLNNAITLMNSRGTVEVGPTLYNQALLIKAKSFIELKKWDEAQTTLNIVLNLLKYNKNDLSKINNYEQLRYALSYLRENYANLYDDKKKPEDLVKALDYTEEMISVINYVKFFYANPKAKLATWNRLDKIIEDGIHYAFTLHELDKNNNTWLEKSFKIIEGYKSQLLLDQLKGRKKSTLGLIPDSLIQQLRKNRINIDILSKYLNKNQELELNVDSLNIENDRLYTELQKKYPNFFYQKDSKLGLAAIQTLLANRKSQLLSYFVGENYLYTILISKDKAYFFRSENAKKIPQLVGQLKDGLYGYQLSTESTDSLYQLQLQNFKYAAIQLYTILVSPFKEHLEDNLIIIPDADLYFVPFEALLKKQPLTNNFRDFNYLLEDHTISYAFSASTLFEKSDNKTFNSGFPLLAVAPAFDNKSMKEAKTRGVDHIALVNNIEEAKKVHLSWGNGLLLTGDDATKESFISQLKDYAILHLATHGYSGDKKAGFSYLLFKNDKGNLSYLYDYELYSMNLSSKLVVLSACETGTGIFLKGEGILSMARAFVNSGVESVIATLWAINDQTTPELMTAFYNHLKKGLPKDQALRQAKLDYLKENFGMATHPYYWASFIGIGDMSNLKSPLRLSFWKFSSISLLLIGLIYFFRKGKKKNMQS